MVEQRTTGDLILGISLVILYLKTTLRRFKIPSKVRIKNRDAAGITVIVNSKYVMRDATLVTTTSAGLNTAGTTVESISAVSGTLRATIVEVRNG